MSAADIIARLDEQRSFWVDLPSDGLRVKLWRPLETELGQFIDGVTIDAVCTRGVGWDGFTEAALLGAGVGASDPVPFDAGLWARYLRDNAAAARTCSTAMVKAIGDYLATKGETAKN